MAIMFKSKEIFNVALNGKYFNAGYFKGEGLFGSEKPVTYIVDTGKQYTEMVKQGQSCLSPITFTPSKTGYRFYGWSDSSGLDSEGTILSNKIMGSEPITLYAVFVKDAKLTVYYESNTNSTTYNTNMYYKLGQINGNHKLYEFNQFNNWQPEGYTTGTDTTCDINYIIGKNGKEWNVKINKENIVVRAVYKQQITLEYYDGQYNQTDSNVRIGNLSSGIIDNPTFTIYQYDQYPPWRSLGFAESNQANATVKYLMPPTGSVDVTLDSNKKLYARYEREIMCTFDSGSAQASGIQDTIYLIQNKGGTGQIENVSFNLPICNYTWPGHRFYGWKESSGGQMSPQGATVVVNKDTHFIAIWS